MRPLFNQWDKMLEKRLIAGGGEVMTPVQVANWKYEVRQAARAKIPIAVKERKFQTVYRSGINGVSAVVTNHDDTLFAISGSAFNRKPLTAEQELAQAEQANRKKEAERWIRDLTGEEKPPAEHMFSWRSRRKANDKMQEALASFKGDSIFLTLTFIQDVDHRLAAKILNKFLNSCRKDFPGLEYIRIAEPQEENNDRIHFHLLVNRYLPVERYNSLWVLQQYNAGLTANRKGGSEIDKWEIKLLHKMGITHRVLSPATMRRAYDADGLAAYLSKYLTKQTEGFKFGCLPWHCSRGVSEVFTRQLDEPETFAKMTNPKYNRYTDRKTKEAKPIKPTHKKFCSNIYVHRKKAILPHIRMMRQTNRWIMEGRGKRANREREEKGIRKIWKREDVMILVVVASARELPGARDFPDRGKWERVAEKITEAIEADRVRQLKEHYKGAEPLITGRDDIPQLSGEQYRTLYLKDHLQPTKEFPSWRTLPEPPERESTALKAGQPFSSGEWKELETQQAERRKEAEEWIRDLTGKEKQPEEIFDSWEDYCNRYSLN